MPKPVRSFSERHAEDEQREALETVTPTERLLAHILIELMDTRTRRKQVEIARRLKRVGFSTKQVAALMGTTPAALAVGERREDPA